MRGVSRRFVKNLEDMACNPRFSPDERFRVSQLLVELLTTAVPVKEKAPFSLKANAQERSKEEALIQLLEDVNEDV